MYQKAVEYAPEDFRNWGSLGDAYSHTEGEMAELAAPMYENAIKLAAERLEVNSRDAITHSLVAHYQARLGNRERALQHMARAQALAPNDMYVHYNSALVLTSLGESEQAIAELELAVSQGYSAKLLNIDAGFDPLKSEPAYVALLDEE